MEYACANTVGVRYNATIILTKNLTAHPESSGLVSEVTFEFEIATVSGRFIVKIHHILSMYFLWLLKLDMLMRHLLYCFI